MNQSMVGDKLLLRNGSVGTFNGLGCTGICDVRYPYTMIYNKKLSSVTKNGLQLVGTTLPKDVIGFATVNTKLNTATSTSMLNNSINLQIQLKTYKN